MYINIYIYVCFPYMYIWIGMDWCIDEGRKDGRYARSVR